MSEKFGLAIIDNSDAINDAAIDAADDRMSEEKEGLKGFRGFLKKMWKHGIAKEYYRQREIASAKKDIKESGNLYIRESGTKKDHDSEMEAIVSRFTSEYDETLHSEAGEMKGGLDENNQHEKQLKEEIINLVKEYASGIINEDAFIEEKTRLFNGVTGLKKDVMGKGQMYADNLLEIAKQIKQNIEHGKKMEEMDLEFDVIVGRAKSGVRTNAQYNAVERIVDKITKTKVGRWFNELTVAAVVGGACSIISSSYRSASTAFGVASFGIGLGAAVGVAAIREGKKQEDDRTQHFRDMAKGKTYGEGSKRREEMEKYRYETREASELKKSLNKAMEELKNSKDTKRYQELFIMSLGILSQIETRIELSDTQHIDLLSYSNPKAVEKERFELDIARAEAKVEIRKSLSSKPELLQGNTFDDTLSKLKDIIRLQITQGDKGIEAKDREFKKMKAKKVAMKALTTLGIGLAVGGIMQEVKSSFDSNQAGFGESLWRKVFHKPDDSSTHTTVFESARRFLFGDHSGFMGGKMEDHVINGANIKLPEGADLIPDGHGGYALVVGNHEIADGLHLNSDGSFTDSAKDILEEHGVSLNEQVSHVAQDTTPAGMVAARPEDFHHVVRADSHWHDWGNREHSGWDGNDTPMPLTDKNELATWLGGKNNCGVDEHGNYVYSVRHMTADGSYQGGRVTDAPEIVRSGEAKAFISLSKDTQNYVYEVPIRTDGTLIIEKGSEVANNCFGVDENGNAVLLAKYLEIGRVMGERADEASMIEIFGTQVGRGIEGTSIVVDHVTNVLDIPTITDMPWFVPIPFGDPMEKAYSSKDPFYIPPERENYYEREGLKSDHTDLKQYRNNPKQVEALIHKMDVKYKYVNEKLSEYKNYDKLSLDKKAKIEEDRKKYNKRYNRNLNIEEYIGTQISRLHQQIENIFIKKAKISEKPFAKDFYLNSPLIKGIENAKEIVLILDQPIGDAVLTIPAILAIEKYLEKSGQTKSIKIITNKIGQNLFKCVADQFPKNIELIEYEKAQQYFKNDKDSKFIINAHKSFKDYDIFSLSEKESRDLSKVMSVDWASWMKEEVPVKEGSLEKYDAIPARVMRNFEVMLGQKLFEDINSMNHFLEKDNDYDRISNELKTKYEIVDGEKVIVMSGGSSVMPKEYEPEKWEKVINGLLQNNGNARILFLEDPDPKRKERYASMLERVASGNNRFRIVNESPSKFNALMSIADVVVTPDTGLGHYASALGTPNVMLILGDPVRWSTKETDRIVHSVGYGVYRKDGGTYSNAWQNDVGYYVNDNGEFIGASNIDPNIIIKSIEGHLNSEIKEKSVKKRQAKRKKTTS